MDDLATLQIRVQSLEAEVADQRLKRLGRTGARTKRATDGLTAAFKRFAGPVAAAAGAVAGLRKVVSITREFEVLNAQLITATGSAESAGVAFEAIQDFASTTPYDLQQVTEGFTKLVNLGLTPSEAALTSYGNTASAMGKDLNQLIEAVADAATGEFERLKEFGIRAKSQGDEVSFIFRGVTTTVGKNAAEIEAYLQALGENEFAGAMQERVNTLDGALSNLGDEWDKLFLNISNQGIGDVIADSVRVAIDVLEELNAMLQSGQFEVALDAILEKFEGFGRDVARTLDIITEIWNEVPESLEGAFRNLPENVRAVIQLMAIEIAALVDYGAEYGAAFGQVLGSEFAKIVEKSKAYGKAIGEALNPFDDGNFDLEDRLRELDAIAADMADQAFSRAEQQVEFSRQARRASIEAILEERDAAVASFNTQIAAAEYLRKKYDEEIAARRAAGGDRLAQFAQGVTGTGTGTGTGEDSGETDQQRKARGAQEEALEDLRKSLRSEEEVIQESYDNRLAIILANTEEGSIQQADLKRRLDEEFATQALGDLAVTDTYEEQLMEVENYYTRRRELILENTALTEEQRTTLEEGLTKQRNQRLEQLETERTATVLSASANLFGNLADLSKQFAGEQSGIYRATFAASKAFAIAESVLKIQQGIAIASSSTSWPANLAAIASTVAATSSIISTIRGTTYSGAYEAGGTIPQGKIGLVGEFGPELVEGPANVRSRRETAQMFREGQDGNGQQMAMMPAPEVNVKNINVLDPAVVGDYLATDEGEQIIMNVVQRNQRAIGF